MYVWKNSLKKYKFFKIKGDSFYFYNGKDQIKFVPKENTIIKGDKSFLLSEDNVIVLLNNVNKSLAVLLDDEANTVVENFNNGKLIYKRTDKTKYCFMCANNDKITYYETSLEEFLKKFDVDTFELLNKSTFSKQNFLAFYESANLNGDKYAVCLIDYLSNNVAKDDVAFINEYEGGDRLFVDREVYGIEDITDIKNIVLNRRGSMFGWRIYYELECKIDSKYYKMKYFPSNVESALWANSPQGKIKISDELLEKIKALTGETQENIRTRKLMQLFNFSYEHKDKWTDEKQQQIVSDFSKVSLNDVQSLPAHWLDKIDDARLYDWLKCSGLQDYKEVRDYVDGIINVRKEKASKCQNKKITHRNKDIK